MPPAIVPRQHDAAPAFVSCPPADEADAALELAAGLQRSPAEVSPKFLYDRLGSMLFDAITALPEYYPTRTEAAVFERHGAEIAAAVGARLPAGFAMVDLGAGDGAKAARLFDALQPARYVAVDISEAYLRSSIASLQQRHPAIRMTGVALDFSRRLALPAGLVEGAGLVFYPGSSIGNFAPPDALRLLRQARAVAGSGGALLIGADLVKDVRVLEAAYDDALGVTAAFNLNLLRHVNTLLGSAFDVTGWRHVALFNAEASRIEMHLEARQAVHVRWPGGGRRFEAGERIHTENSYKWTPETFEALLDDAGWHDVQCWTDPQRWFGVFLARA
jgi:dimethylhistidine N-methyltransferase